MLGADLLFSAAEEGALSDESRMEAVLQLVVFSANTSECIQPNRATYSKLAL